MHIINLFDPSKEEPEMFVGGGVGICPEILDPQGVGADWPTTTESVKNEKLIPKLPKIEVQRKLTARDVVSKGDIDFVMRKWKVILYK